MLSFVGTGVGIWLGISSTTASLTTSNATLLDEAVATTFIPVLTLGLVLIRRISLRSLGEWGWIALIAASVVVSIAGLDQSLFGVLRGGHCE